MQLHFLDRSTENNSSFTSRLNEYPYFLKIWHYHPELELVAILKSKGSCYVGDKIEKFVEGDVFLIGKNTPHIWLNDEAYFEEGSSKKAKALAIHFKKDFLGASFFHTPEMIHLLELFDRARFGIKFLNMNKKFVKTLLSMSEQSGYYKTISFLNILNKLSKHKEFKLLASPGFMNTFQKTKNKTFDKVYEYIFKNFNKDISLIDVADIANMNSSAFSRSFKKINRKTYSRYISELRVGYACKLLLENNSNISAICYDAGFNNISNFNRQFKRILNCTPSEYIKQHSK